MNYPVSTLPEKWKIVEKIARTMCEQCELEPDRMTTAKLRTTVPIWGGNIPVDKDILVPEWETFVRAASEAYIGWKAVQQYMLVDA